MGASRTSNPFRGIHRDTRAEEETPLRAWCLSTGITPWSIAKQMKVAHNAVRMWYTGRTLPSLVNAYRLERITKGGVPTASWLGTILARQQWNQAADWEGYELRRREEMRKNQPLRRANRKAAESQEQGEDDGPAEPNPEVG